MVKWMWLLLPYLYILIVIFLACKVAKIKELGNKKVTETSEKTIKSCHISVNFNRVRFSKKLYKS